MNNRFRLLLILLGALLVAATFTFPRWWPLVNRDPGDVPVEALAAMAPELRPTFEALPPEQRLAYQQRAVEDGPGTLAMIEAALAAPTVVPDIDQALPSMSGPVEVASGAFQRVDALRFGQGDVTVFEQADGRRVVRFENFTVVNGPALHVYLSAVRDAATAASTPLGASDIDLGPLLGSVGAQNYELPAEIDLDRYNSILVYSRALGLVYPIAPLRMA